MAQAKADVTHLDAEYHLLLDSIRQVSIGHCDPSSLIKLKTIFKIFWPLTTLYFYPRSASDARVLDVIVCLCVNATR